MQNRTTSISEDKAYKPSAPDKPRRRFILDCGEYRWEVFVSRYEIRETGTPVFHAVSAEGYSVYGMTDNEAVNEMAGIMESVLSSAKSRTVAFESVRHCLDSIDAAREELKIAEAYSRKPLWQRLLTTI